MKGEVARYIELHRAMGYQYRVQAYMLESFAAFVDSRDQPSIRTQTVLDWAALAPSLRQRRDRLLTVRRFALSLHAENASHEVPPADVFGRARSKRKCHIFTPEEIKRLLHAASQLAPRGSIRPATYTALFSLIAATGLRISEALKLQLADMTDDGLLIRATKFQKNRLVPVHESTRQGLQPYLAIRKGTKTASSTIFISQRGVALPYSTVITTFLGLVRSIGLREGPGVSGCRIHDLRHTFAVRSLEQCQGDRKAVARHMIALSTYLGHAHVSDTYWYLQATNTLLTDVASVCEALQQGRGQ
jgi:integrase